MQDAMALDLRGAGDSIEGWLPFEQVGLLLDEPTYDDRGYALVPYDAAGWFDSIKKWVKKAAQTVKTGFNKVKKGLSAVLDSSIGQAAQNYLSMIPGYGTAISAGLGALNSALKGNKWSQVLMDAAQKAIPGGKIAQTAFAAARGALEGALSGKGVGGALAGAASKALGSGLAGVLPKGISDVLGKPKETAGISPIVVASALSRNGRVAEARRVAQELVDRPELRGLNTRQLAAALGCAPPIAQAGQAALLKFIAPNAPAFPAGASLDTAGGFLGAAAAPVVSAAVPLRHGVQAPPFRRMSPTAVAMLPHLVPGLRRVDPRFVNLAAAGRPKHRVRLVVRNGDVRGIEGAKWRVSAGEYYAKIAAAMGHPNETIALIKANPSIPSPYTLQPGQLINLPEAWLAGMQPAPAPLPSPSPSPSPTGNTYTVKVGDTMGIIAAKHGHPNDVAVLIKANPQIKDPNRIYPGDEINIPSGWIALGGGGQTPVPPPKVEPGDPEPDWYIPGTNPDDYQLPDGSWETFPGEAYQSKLPSEVWARVQTELAAWNKATPGACTPADFGQPTDFTAVWDNRTQQAIQSYQKWANTRGETLRTDGVLDDLTQDSLDRTFAAIIKGQQAPTIPVPPNVPPAPPPSNGPVPGLPNIPGLPQIPPLPGVPPNIDPNNPPAPAPLPSPKPTNSQEKGGNMLLALLPIAAAFLS